MRKFTIVVALLLVVAIAAPAVQGDSFPDVDEDHWAYEAVEALVAAGIVEGYPDGEYKGDETITRYEMAMMVQRAVENINEELDMLDTDIMYIEDDIAELEEGLTAGQAEDVVAIVERMIEDVDPDMPEELTEKQAEQVTEIVEAMVAEFETELDEMDAELGALRYVIDTQTELLRGQVEEVEDTIADVEDRVDELEDEQPSFEFTGEFTADFEHDEIVDLGCMGVLYDDHVMGTHGFVSDVDMDVKVVDVPAHAVDADDFEVDPAGYAHQVGDDMYEFRDMNDFAQWLTQEIAERMQEEPNFDAHDSFEDYLANDILSGIEGDLADINAISYTAPGAPSVTGATFGPAPSTVFTETAESTEFSHTGLLSLGLDVYDEDYEASLDVDLLTDLGTYGISGLEFQLATGDYDFHYVDNWFEVATDDVTVSYGDPNTIDFADYAAFDTSFQGLQAEFWGGEVFFGKPVGVDSDIDIDYSYDFFYDGEEKADWEENVDEMVSVTPVPDYYLSGAQRTFSLMDFDLDATAVTQKHRHDWLHEINRIALGLETDYSVAGIDLGADLGLSSNYRFGDLGLYARGDMGAEFEGIVELTGDVRWRDEDFRPLYDNPEVFDEDKVETDPITGAVLFDGFEDGVYPGEVAFNVRADQDLVDLLEEGYVDFSFNAGDWLAMTGAEVAILDDDLSLDASFQRHHWTESWGGIVEEEGAVEDEPGTEYAFNDDQIDAGLSFTFDPVTVSADYTMDMHPDAYEDILEDEDVRNVARFVEPGFTVDPDKSEDFEEGDSIDDLQEISVSAAIEDLEFFDVTFGASAGYTMVMGQDLFAGENLGEDHFVDPEVAYNGHIYEADENIIDVGADVSYTWRGATFSNDFGVEMLSGEYHDYIAEALYDELFTDGRIDDEYDGESGARNVFTNTFGISYDLGEGAGLNFDWVETYNSWGDSTIDDHYEWQTRELTAGVEVEF